MIKFLKKPEHQSPLKSPINMPMSAISHAKYRFSTERNLYFQNVGKKTPLKDFPNVFCHKK